MRIDLASPLEEIRPDPRHAEVLLVVSVAGRVVGQVFVEARPVLTPEAQWEAIAGRLATPVMRGVVGARLAAARPEPEGEVAERMSVAVAVCTRDRAEQLTECLASIARLRTRPTEVIVVDNSGGDRATAAACEQHGARHVVEPVAGQTRARNRALLETGADLIAFTDDDCVVDEAWLDGIGRPFGDPMVMCVTGYLGPLELETPAQYLFERHGGFERRAQRVVYDIGRIQPQRGAAVAGAGANMVFRRAVFAEIGNFAEDLGPGTPARSADDKYQFYRVLAAGYRIVYEPQRVVWHRHRRDMSDLRRIFNDYGTAEYAYSTRCLLRHREPTALFVYAWWLRHVAGHVRRTLKPGHDEVPVTLALEELRGMLAGPRALARSIASRRGITPLPRPDPASPARSVARVEAEPPRLSVAISTFNRRDVLRRCLAGLCAQDLDADRYEAVVVIDGSTDGSAEMARALETPFPLRVIEQPNSGVAVGRNRGAEEARHPVVVFLDDDIEPLPGTLAAHAAAHAAAPEPHFALGYYPPAQTPDTLWAAIIRLWWEDHFRRKGEPDHQWTFLDIVDGNSSIHVRQLFELGAYDERFGRGRRQDYELGVRMLARNVPVRFHRATQARHHLDVSLEAAFRNAREEGRSDVTLATIHPRVKGRLPLAKIAERTRGGRPAARLGTGAAGLVRSESTIPAIRALERARLRRRAIWLLNRGLVRDYTLGAADACGGAEGLAAFLGDVDEARATADVRLDAPTPVTLPRDPEPVDLQLTYRGHPVATVEAMPPDRQWDWQELAERLEGEAAGPLALRLAVDALPAEELAPLSSSGKAV